MFILIVGLIAHAWLASNIVLGLFLIGWVPAAIVLNIFNVEVKTGIRHHRSRGLVWIVIAAAVVAAVASTFVIPLFAYAFSPIIWIVVLVLGFGPTSVLAVIRSFQ